VRKATLLSTVKTVVYRALELSEAEQGVDCSVYLSTGMHTASRDIHFHCMMMQEGTPPRLGLRGRSTTNAPVDSIY
jgi:hypothetical protein